MAKVKVATLFMIVLLVLFSTLTYASRPEPASTNSSPAGAGGADAVDECEGLGEDECLARRTLAAHLDYIYTQNHKDHP